MSREKLIAEIARDFNKGMCSDRESVESCIDCVGASEECLLYGMIATRIYNAGYRKQEWISVEERLPDGDGDFLVFNDYYGVIIGHYFARGRYFISKACAITHWMPLPEAPKMKGGAE